MPQQAPSFQLPPVAQNANRETRRAGFEIEFAAEDVRPVASLVHRLFGGTLEKIDPHRYQITDSTLGKFTVELDTQYAHPDNPGSWKEKDDIEDMLEVAVKEYAHTLIGDLSKNVVPYEIVTPPIPFDRLDQLTPLISGLQALGAKGTDESPIYAFGLHINPEVPAEDCATLLNYLRAYLLLSEWLREESRVDVLRRLSPYIDAFPMSYAMKVLHPSYQPDLPQLIDDYLLDNPTRNRELDFLPLFTWLDKDRVKRALPDDNLTSARPTFHYRLPDCRLNDPDWSVAREWNLWVEVERLAGDSTKLDKMSRAYIKNSQKWFPRNWSAQVRKWLAG